MLRLQAQDADDVAVLSAMLQDSIVPTAQIVWFAEQQRFALLAARFCWEQQGHSTEQRQPEQRQHEQRQPEQRQHCRLWVEGVQRVRHKDFSLDDDMLLLLAITTTAHGLELTFSGGTAIRLEATDWHIFAEDVGEAWPASRCPHHDDNLYEDHLHKDVAQNAPADTGIVFSDIHMLSSGVRYAPLVAQELADAIAQLKSDTVRFVLLHRELAKPYKLEIALNDGRLILRCIAADTPDSYEIRLAVAALRADVRDYFALCESWSKALPQAQPEQLQSIDMARRGLHDEGARRLQELLAKDVAMDLATARRFFTLVCVLHLGQMRQATQFLG